MDNRYKILVIEDLHTPRSGSGAERDIYEAAAKDLGVVLDETEMTEWPKQKRFRDIKEICEELKALNWLVDKPDLNPPAADSEIRSFEQKTGERLPVSLSELFRQFNGGELFVPGTTIHGLDARGKALSLSEVQCYRTDYGIPDNYLIFATLNFGDLIVIDKRDGRIAQFDHERAEFTDLSWPDLASWLKDTIDTETEYRHV